MVGRAHGGQIERNLPKHSPLNLTQQTKRLHIVRGSRLNRETEDIKMRKSHRHIAGIERLTNGHTAHVRYPRRTRVLQVREHRVCRHSDEVIDRRLGAINHRNQGNEGSRKRGIDCRGSRSEEKVEAAASHSLRREDARKDNCLGIRQRLKRAVAPNQPKKQSLGRLRRMSTRLGNSPSRRGRHSWIPVGKHCSEGPRVARHEPEPELLDPSPSHRWRARRGIQSTQNATLEGNAEPRNVQHEVGQRSGARHVSPRSNNGKQEPVDEHQRIAKQPISKLCGSNGRNHCLKRHARPGRVDSVVCAVDACLHHGDARLRQEVERHRRKGRRPKLLGALASLARWQEQEVR